MSAIRRRVDARSRAFGPAAQTHARRRRASLVGTARSVARPAMCGAGGRVDAHRGSRDSAETQRRVARARTHPGAAEVAGDTSQPATPAIRAIIRHVDASPGAERKPRRALAPRRRADAVHRASVAAHSAVQPVAVDRDTYTATRHLTARTDPLIGAIRHVTGFDIASGIGAGIGREVESDVADFHCRVTSHAMFERAARNRDRRDHGPERSQAGQPHH